MAEVNLWQEFKKQYAGTFFRVRLKSGAKRIVFWPSDWDMDNETTTFSVKTRNEGTMVLKFNSTKYKDFDFKFPDVGMFNLDGMSWAFLRIPQRQWHRGICNGTAQIKDLIPAARSRRVASYNQIHSVLSHETLAAAFWGDYPSSLVQACEQLNGETMFGIALNRQLSLLVDFREEKFNSNFNKILYWFSVPIGEVSLTNKTIMMHNHVLAQEVIDYMNRTSQTGWAIQ
jgi:hypothetical protein